MLENINLAVCRTGVLIMPQGRKGRRMVKVSRSAVIIMGLVALVGCVSTATSISGSQRLVSAEPIQTEFTVPMTPVSGVAPVLWSPATATGHEKEYLGYVLLDSGRKCQEFTNRLSVAQRGVDTSFDILTVILSALATAFTPLSTVHGLTAAATISTGTKAAINADVYAKATAALILQEINQTYYADIDKYRTELSKTQDAGVIPTIELSKIEAIHRECSLDAAIASLSQSQAAASASLAAISGAFAGASAARQQGLSPEAGAIAGAAAGAAAGASGMTAAPEAAAKQGATAGENAVRPPAPTPGQRPGPSAAPSQSLFLPGPPSTTSGTVLPTPPTQQETQMPPPAPHRRSPQEPSCLDMGPVIPLACPPLPPELQSRRKEVSGVVRKLSDVARLQTVATALGVSTPVATVRCMRRDILNHIEQACTSEQVEQMSQAFSNLRLPK
jgi:hypothetical protein